MRFALLLLSLVSASALGADANTPHPHQGIVAPYEGVPPTPNLDAEDLAKLTAGEAVQKQFKGGSGGRGMAIQDIHAPVDVVWGRIMDYASYPEMVDNVKLCEVYAQSEERVKVRFILSAMMMNVEYFIDHSVDKDRGYMTWKLDYSRDSDLDDSVGMWVVQPIPERPGWTRVFYSVEVRLKGWLPGAIEDMIAKKGLTKATEWVKRESELKAGATQ